MSYPTYLVHFNPNHDPKTGRFDFRVGAVVDSTGAVRKRNGEIDTNPYKYIDKKGYRSKKPMGLTKVGINRVRKLDDITKEASKAKQKYMDAIEDGKVDKSTIDSYEKEYRDIMNFLKQHVTDQIREYTGVDEEGYRYVSIHFTDPLTRKAIFSQQVLKDMAKVNPDGTYTYKNQVYDYQKYD